jgi:hypothetical protein
MHEMYRLAELLSTSKLSSMELAVPNLLQPTYNYKLKWQN